MLSNNLTQMNFFLINCIYNNEPVFPNGGVVVYGIILIYLFFIGQEGGVRMANGKQVVKAVLATGFVLLLNQLIGLGGEC
jgi:hypothetical protein